MNFFEQVRGRLIVSCQALPDEPLHSSFIMGRMARAAKEGGAVAIRAQSAEDIVEIKQVTGLPVIGLVKRNYEDSDVYITPTLREVDELPEDLRLAAATGIWAPIVGSAITRPQMITKSFANVLEN